MVSEAQKRANYKWLKAHADKRRQYQYSSYSRKFVRDIANKDQLIQLKEMINNRLDQL